LVILSGIDPSRESGSFSPEDDASVLQIPHQ
jgi:hypothetical protein